MSIRTAGLVALAAALLVPASATGQTIWPDGWGFQWQVGYKQMGGGWSDLLDSGVDADINIFYNLKKFRIGAGGNFVSFDVKPPLEDESVSSVEMHAFFSYHFTRGSLQPFVQGRGTWTRLRPEGHDFGVEPEEPVQLPEDVEEGENTEPRRSGFGFGLAAGLEWRISWAIGLELVGSYDRFSTEDVDLTEFGFQQVFNNGDKWGARVGINWYP